MGQRREDRRSAELRYRPSELSKAGSWVPGSEGGSLAGASWKVDPIYETLRYGTSLALMNRSSFSSTSESPTRSLVWWTPKGNLRGRGL